MNHRSFITALILMLPFFFTACAQKTTEDGSETPAEENQQAGSNKSEPHNYGGWYCPDNFGFTPVDIQKLDEVPAISDRLPTEEELHENKSLINVDIEKYPDARALGMELPRVASIYSERTGMDELIIVIQAIVVQEDTVVGYRFANGGNGSAWMSNVKFLSEDEVADMGSQPFFYSKSLLKANTAEIWSAIGKTDYFKQLGEKFGKQTFFSSAWDPEAEAHLKLETKGENASGYVGMVFGNYYLHIDYIKDGYHYSEKLLISEDQEENTTELHFTCGPYPEGFEKQQAHWNSWVEAVKNLSENF